MDRPTKVCLARLSSLKVSVFEGGGDGVEKGVIDHLYSNGIDDKDYIEVGYVDPNI